MQLSETIFLDADIFIEKKTVAKRGWLTLKNGGRKTYSYEPDVYKLVKVLLSGPGVREGKSRAG
jgi:hypothetical protein